MERKYDVVVFGATGFTGQFVTQELATYHPEIKWSIAGRSVEKLKNLLKEIGKEIGKNLDSIDVMYADSSDDTSISDMCKSTVIVINCVGPYRFYGEKVVEQCVKNGTHHVDMSGEAQFLETMQLKYFDEAKEKGIYIVGACGFDSIPNDLGIEVVRRKFEGDCHSVETYFVDKPGPEGRSMNFGTWQSAIHGRGNAHELKSLRDTLVEKIFPEPLPNSNFKIEKKPYLFKSNLANGWCLPFIGSDLSVITRTQMFNYIYKKEKPVQVQLYMRTVSLMHAIVLIIMGGIFVTMAKFSCGRNLLEKHPKIFSFGTFSKNPDKQKNLNGEFSIIFKAKGWNEKLSNTDEQHATPPNKTATAVLKGPDPGYVATSIMMVNSALVILQEKEKMPLSGGVFSPGAAFIDTSLVERLESRGITISELEYS